MLPQPTAGLPMGAPLYPACASVLAPSPGSAVIAMGHIPRCCLNVKDLLGFCLSMHAAMRKGRRVSRKHLPLIGSN